jgi:hypothetical protein
MPERSERLNVRISVDYTLSRGEDPQPLYDLLRERMRAATFDYYMFPAPSELGHVSVEVEDDYLAEALQIFRTALRDVGTSHEPYIEARYDE